MTAGVTGYSRVQMGHESTAGTAVAATALWRGPAGQWKDGSVLVFPNENAGYISGHDRAYIPQYVAELDLPPTEATFEQLGYVLGSSISHQAGTQDGSGTDYIYTHTLPTTSANTIKTRTIEAGDNGQEEEAEYCFVDNFTLEGAGGAGFGAWMVSSKWIGRQITVSSFTSLIAAPAVDTMLFGKSKLYIDAIGGTIGSTQITSQFLGAKLSFKSGWVPRFSGEGNLYFTRIAHTKEAMELKCEITLEHDSTAVAEKVISKAPTSRLVRIDIDGPTVGTPGTTYSTKKLRINMAGKWEIAPPIESQNGNNVVKMTFRSRYSTTSSSFASMVLVNELNGLT